MYVQQYSVKEAAQYLGLSVASIYDKIRRGTLAATLTADHYYQISALTLKHYKRRRRAGRTP